MNILIAEDEKDIMKLIEIHLKSEGYCIFLAKDGEEAVKLFENNEIDLAILDINIPKIDGFDLLNIIRSNSNIPIIFLTARTEEQDKILGLALGADDYLIKPISMLELKARVKAHLRRNYDYLAHKSEEVFIESGRIRINTDECSVRISGKEIQLNAKEYKLLLFLMKNKGKVFTKKQIYEKVWGDNYYGDNNTIMVYISRLRSKIEKDSQSPKFIKTIRGIGYRFEG